MLRALVAVALATALWPSHAAHAQAPPVSADAVRAQIASAAECYDFVDYRCVITALEGPLLAREELPDGLTDDEIRTGYELLGMAYFAVDLDDDARRAFARLVERDTDYRLDRPDAAPEHVALVELLAETEHVRRRARTLAEHVTRRAVVTAALPNIPMRARAHAARWVASDLAAAVRARARTFAPDIVDPPWGPWSGPDAEIGLAVRPLWGSDADVFGVGFGLDARIAARFRPLFLGVHIAWTRHETTVDNPVVTPAPSLDALAFAGEVGLRWDGGWLGGGFALEGGGQYLHVSEALQSVQPYVALDAHAQFRLGDDFAIRVHASGGALFGPLDDGSFGVSVASLTSLALAYIP